MDEVRGFSETIPTFPATPAPAKKRTASERLTAIGQTIRDKQAAVGIMQTVVERLGNQHCTGRPWYRTTDKGKRYLYAIHPAGRPCPICGSHPDGARLRKMIAEADTDEATKHQQLMTAAADYQKAREKLQRLEEQLQTIDRLIWQLEAATK
jgi:DNA repair exonuclease SbcCD ATPase subunit